MQAPPSAVHAADALFAGQSSKPIGAPSVLSRPLIRSLPGTQPASRLSTPSLPSPLIGGLQPQPQLSSSLVLPARTWAILPGLQPPTATFVAGLAGSQQPPATHVTEAAPAAVAAMANASAVANSSAFQQPPVMLATEAAPDAVAAAANASALQQPPATADTMVPPDTVTAVADAPGAQQPPAASDPFPESQAASCADPPAAADAAGVAELMPTEEPVIEAAQNGKLDVTEAPKPDAGGDADMQDVAEGTTGSLDSPKVEPDAPAASVSTSQLEDGVNTGAAVKRSDVANQSLDAPDRYPSADHVLGASLAEIGSTAQEHNEAPETAGPSMEAEAAPAAAAGETAEAARSAEVAGEGTPPSQATSAEPADAVNAMPTSPDEAPSADMGLAVIGRAAPSTAPAAAASASVDAALPEDILMADGFLAIDPPSPTKPSVEAGPEKDGKPLPARAEVETEMTGISDEGKVKTSPSADSRMSAAMEGTDAGANPVASHHNEDASQMPSTNALPASHDVEGDAEPPAVDSSTMQAADSVAEPIGTAAAAPASTVAEPLSAAETLQTSAMPSVAPSALMQAPLTASATIAASEPMLPPVASLPSSSSLQPGGLPPQALPQANVQPMSQPVLPSQQAIMPALSSIAAGANAAEAGARSQASVLPLQPLQPFTVGERPSSAGRGQALQGAMGRGGGLQKAPSLLALLRGIASPQTDSSGTPMASLPAPWPQVSREPHSPDHHLQEMRCLKSGAHHVIGLLCIMPLTGA